MHINFTPIFVGKRKSSRCLLSRKWGSKNLSFFKKQRFPAFKKKYIFLPFLCLLELPYPQKLEAKENIFFRRNSSSQEIERKETKENSSERILVRGEPADPDKITKDVSGTRAHYLNKNADFGPMGNLPLKKTPFSVFQISHDVIENQQLRYASQMLSFNPSVQIHTTGSPASVEIENRGFLNNTFANSRLDGLNSIMSTPLASEMVQNMTILNGLAGAMYGPESPAGVVNTTLKRPTEIPFFNFNFGYDASGSPLESLDTSLGKGPIKIRFNYINQTGQMYVKGMNQWRDAYSGDIDIQLDKRTKLELDAGQYNMSYSGMPGRFTYGMNMSLPQAPSAATPGFGQNYSGVNFSSTYGIMKLKHDFSPNFHFSIGGLYEVSPRYTHGITNQLLNTLGAFKQTASAQPSGNQYGIWSNYAYINATLHTGPLLHHLNLGTNGYEGYENSPTRYQLGIDVIPNDNLHNPIIAPSGTEPKETGSYRQNAITQQSLLVGDQIDIGKFFTVTGQFSFGYTNVKNWKRTGAPGYPNGSYLISPSGGSRAMGSFSPAVGFNFHPIKNLSAYFNWGKSTGVGSSASAGSANAGEMLPIYHSEQFEGGIKYLYQNRLSINLDGFSIESPYAFTDPNTRIYGYNGIQKDTGIEFQTSGALTKDISILGGVTYLHPLIEHAATSSGINNMLAAGVPAWNVNFLLDYHPKILHGIAFNANTHYTSARPANIYNTTWADQYVTLDLGMRYSTKICDHIMVFRGEVDNVTNETYWNSLSPSASPGASGTNGATLGLPRVWHITASVYF
ncbi:hypothetical protein FAI40_01245 [Acetobacteraceae bacterium]|nr:hypothetical protein FAI40_01245 [Acetobacteraceae bacterium]